MFEKIKEWIRWEPAGLGKIRRDNKQILIALVFLIFGSVSWIAFFYTQTFFQFGWALFGSIWFYHAYKEWNFNR